MDFLKYNSPFMTGLRNVVNYILLGLLWVIASIPIVTFGAATTAVFFTAEKTIRNGEERIFGTFWISFRDEFKQATLLWMLELVLLVVLGLNVFFIWLVEPHEVIFVMLLVAILTVFGWMQLWFVYLSKFKDTTLALLRNTFRMAIGNFPWVLLLIALAAAAIVGFAAALFFVSPFVLLIPGIYIMLVRYVFLAIFKVYLPAETPESMQD